MRLVPFFELGFREGGRCDESRRVLRDLGLLRGAKVKEEKNVPPVWYKPESLKAERLAKC